jgi:hypothetical protein
MMKNWQTTVAGLGCIAAGVYLLSTGKGFGLISAEASAVVGVALIAAGLGLIRAKDSTTHSTAAEVGQASADEKQKAIDAANK